MSFEQGVSAVVPITDTSSVGEARRAATAHARRVGFGETECEGVAIVATEAASNVVKHAGRGEVVIRPLLHAGVAGVELLALDRGPGMADIARCMVDGFSTGGSPGTGLGAISRLSHTTGVHSSPGQGTSLLARLWSTPADHSAATEVGAICLPKPGEDVCGDAWGVVETESGFTLLVADGLGHGPLAATASRAAVAVLGRSAGRTPAEIVGEAHNALRATRGAAVAVARFDRETRTLVYAGIGNIAGIVVSGTETRQMVSLNGTVGLDSRRVREFTYPFPVGARLIMHSDGLATHWRVDAYPGLWQRHPSLVAGVLYRDFARGRDDVTVVVVSETARRAA